MTNLRQLNLDDLKAGFPGTTIERCLSHLQACLVCLTKKHVSGVDLGIKGDSLEIFQHHFRQAFELEQEAAHLLESSTLEPTRSIIHRSAATLARDCGEIREAEKLAAIGLAGDPPKIIAKELRELLQQVFAAMAEKAVGD